MRNEWDVRKEQNEGLGCMMIARSIEQCVIVQQPSSPRTFPLARHLSQFGTFWFLFLLSGPVFNEEGRGTLSGF
jgi:hypothetical protein